MSTQTLGGLLHEARVVHDLTLQDVAARARCSPGYVHKLEADRVRTPSPRVLAGLADALGLGYPELMTAAGFDPPRASDEARRPGVPAAVKRFSNAHIVELLEQLQTDVRELRRLLESPTSAKERSSIGRGNRAATEPT
jgi:transcriptional regulator with XRE-family HTH domain